MVLVNDNVTTKADVFLAANRLASRELAGFDRAIKILKKKRMKENGSN